MKQDTAWRETSLHYVETVEMLIDCDHRLLIEASRYHRFAICSDTSLRVADAQKRQPIEAAAGDLIYIPADYAVNVLHSSSSPARMLLILFDVTTANNGQTSLINPFVLQSFRMPQMKNWLSAFNSNRHKRDPSVYYQFQSRLYALASVCLTSARKGKRKEPELPEFVEQARRRILESYDTILDMDSMARNSGVSTSKFYRLFREHTGLSPLKYLITTRLKASLRLLADPDVSVMEAAHSIGYPDEFYFSRLFKKEMGITPSEYALRAQVSIASLCPIFAGDLAVLGLQPRVSLKRDWDTDLGNRDKYMQEIKQAKPDHILTGPISEDLYHELARIAPVSMIHWHRYSWKKRLVEFANLLGIPSVATRWLADFERKTNNARRLIQEKVAQTPFLIVGHRKCNFRLYGRRRRKFTDLLYDELGFECPHAMEEIEYFDSASLHDAAKLDCDNVIFLSEFPASHRYGQQLEEEWKQLRPDPQGKRCFFIRLEGPFLYNAAMHERLVDQMVSHLHEVKLSR